jgi:glycerophosphoryl diester phosphodiesterase
MKPFEIVAHRGVPDFFPENTIPAFQRAIELGADAVELDVRLTSDQVPVVFHYFYLDEITPISGTVFQYTLNQLQEVEVRSKNSSQAVKIPTLIEVLETIGGQISLEIEIKGPEPESSKIIANVLSKYKNLWETIEVTSYEPILLIDIQQLCTGLTTDLLFPRSETWMKLDVVTYSAIQHARLAHARAVHLHPTQLTSETVEAIRKSGIEVHAWDVNDLSSLKLAAKLEIPRICTDGFQQAFGFRKKWNEQE